MAWAFRGVPLDHSAGPLLTDYLSGEDVCNLFECPPVILVVRDEASPRRGWVVTNGKGGIIAGPFRRRDAAEDARITWLEEALLRALTPARRGT
jgi:hypothetical protein